MHAVHTIIPVCVCICVKGRGVGGCGVTIYSLSTKLSLSPRRQWLNLQLLQNLFNVMLSPSCPGGDRVALTDAWTMTTIVNLH